MRDRKSRTTKTRSNKVNFVSTIQSASKANARSAPNLRFGLAHAVKRLAPSQYRTAANELFLFKEYENLAVTLAFPPTYSDLVKTTEPLGELTIDQAFMWNASVLSHYRESLCEFAKLQHQFESFFIHGDFESATESLDKIEAAFGVSNWLIIKRINLLQRKGGTSEQKKYIESIFKNKDLSLNSAIVAYYTSMACQDDFSIYELEAEIAPLLKQPVIKDFMIYYIAPYMFCDIENVGSVLQIEETQPLIDRLQALISMAQLHAAKFGIKTDGYVYKALKALESIPDNRIKKLICVAESTDDPLDDEHVLSIENYTNGNYSKINSSSMELVEMEAAKYCHLNQTPPLTERSIRSEIVFHFFQVLNCSEKKLASVERLKKLSLFSGVHSIPFKIRNFLDGGSDSVMEGTWSTTNKLAAISGLVKNPQSYKVFKSLNEHFSPKYVQALSSSKLFHALSLNYVEGVQFIDEIEMPMYRSHAYKGHLAYLKGMYDLAASHYRAAMITDGAFVRNRAEGYLFKALFKSESFSHCADIMAEDILRTASHDTRYPIAEMCEKIVGYPELATSTSAAIILCVASRAEPDYERSLSDYYENIMHCWGYERPSEIDISNLTKKESHKKIIFFLRYICVPRILDDTTCFNSVDDIDQERILICQKLLELDSENKSAHSAEIRSITRDSRVSQLLQQIQASNVYVDEDGIKSSIEIYMRERFNKFKALVDSPELDAQAVEISKEFERIIDKSEIKVIDFPMVDKRGIFSGMLHYYITSFALNPAYGLDTHLSTTVRHGKFEGRIRSPLSAYDLLCYRSESGYAPPVNLRNRLQDIPDTKKIAIFKALRQFTKRVETCIDEYLRDYLHIKTDTKPLGMLDFFATDEHRERMLNVIDNETTYETFIDLLTEYAWDMTDLSLRVIRESIEDNLRKKINNSFERLLKDVRPAASDSLTHPLIDAIVKARTDVNKSISEIKAWFKKPLKVRNDPFEFDLAVDVAQKQIENCYFNTKLQPSRKIQFESKIEGKYLNGIVEVLFILLQNIVIHGDVDEHTVVGIEISANDSDLYIRIENSLSSTADIPEITRSAEEAVLKYNDLSKARIEGGSGVSKIWRILEYFLKTKSSVSMSVSESRKFSTTLLIYNIESLKC